MREIFRTSIGSRWLVCIETDENGPLRPRQFGMTEVDVVLSDDGAHYDRETGELTGIAGSTRIVVMGA